MKPTVAFGARRLSAGRYVLTFPVRDSGAVGGVKKVLKLIEATPLAGYRLRLRYADGVTGVVDLSHLVGKGVFELWNDPEAFARVSIGTGGELCWSDQVDLCADALYLEVTGKRPDEAFPSLRKVSADA